MIRYITGDILASPAQALVNPVNIVGVMGKGLALAFKQAYPENFRAYAAECRDGWMLVGSLFVFREAGRQIVNFPTKQHWRDPSRIEWIRDGLDMLRWTIPSMGVESIAVPALGCGINGLSWPDVKAEIEKALAGLNDVEVTVYEPMPGP